MAGAEQAVVGIAKLPIRDGVDTSGASRRELRDLAVLLALPAMWVDLNPADIAAGLLDALFGMFRLSSGYVRFDGPAAGPALECWRPRGSRIPRELETVIAATPTREQGVMTTAVAAPDGNDHVRVISMSPSFPGENGIVVVGSAKTDFPTDFELHLLRTAVGQAAISIHSALRLAAERSARVAAEAALQRRNAFLASFADDLAGPLTLLAERAAQAHHLAVELPAPSATNAAAIEPIAAPSGTDASLEGNQSPASPARLTRREAEVLGLLAQGLSNKEIAAVLWLSDRTIERHITGLYRKIGVERRTEATAFALRHGLVDSGEHEL